jgi:hypothetical protein
VTGKITLTNELTITSTVTIAGPGDDLLTISGNTNSRVFAIRTGTVELFGLTLADGRQPPGNAGGCISNSASLTITACTLSNNSTFLGNAVYNKLGSVTVRDSTFLNNQSLAGAGGAIYNDGGTAVIFNCAMYSNRTHQGTILNSGFMAVTNCTIFGNIAEEFGGGIANSGSMVVRSCTIVSNRVNDYWSVGRGGGGISTDGSGVMDIGNTIVANNISTTNHPDCFGTNIISAGYNLVGKRDGSAGWGGVEDKIGTVASPLYPKLGPFQNNGGRTLSMLPLPGSLTIDQGKSFGVTTDQRGIARPADYASIPNATGGDGSDIGAVEVWPAAPQLNIQVVGTNVLLCWSTNAPDFRLQG